MSELPCPICEWPTISDPSPAGDSHIFNCSRCGQYVLTGSAQAIISNDLRHNRIIRAVLSHQIRKAYAEAGILARVDSSTVSFVRGLRKLPSTQKQADGLILWLAENQESPSDYVLVPEPEVGAIIGTADVGPDAPREGLLFIVAGLESAGIIERLLEFEVRARLSYKGQASYEKLKVKETKKGARTDAIPASDRVVALNHNAPEYKQSVEVLPQIIDAVQGNNEYGATGPEEKEQRVGELKAGGILFQARRISTRVLEWLIAALRAVLPQVRDEVIKKGATGLIDYLISLMHR